ncbi:hypothetical protein DHD32_22380, partial [Arenibacter sp. TNZ]|nr:hypothetical protein [Arenibacter sp. TNZ]
MSVQAQIKIGDNPQNIDPSSVLELESSSRVLVITRVNSAQMNAIVPSAGALVYNTDIQCIHYYTGTEWKDICDAVAGSITFTSDDGTVVITPNGGNNYDVKVGQITGMNIVNETIFGADIATATIGERQLAPNSVGSSELQDNTVGKTEIQEAAVGTLEIIDGTIQPSDMQPGAFDQILTTNAAGTVVWLNKNELGATQADQTTITGAGTSANPIKVADTVIGDILANTNSITVNTNNIAQNSNDITAINTALGTKEDVANKSDDTALGNSTTLYPTQNAVKTYVDLLAGAASTLADGNIFVGSAGNVASGVTMGGDATILNTGAVTIADNAITSSKIAPFAVGTPHLSNSSVTSAIILNANVTPIKIQPGAANQIMTTNTLGVVSWQPISAVGGNQDLASVLGFGTSAGNNQINNLADPTAPQDAATQAYVDAQVGGSAQTIVSANTPNSISAGSDGGAYYNDLDPDPLNEIELPTGGTAGQVLSTDGSGGYTWITDNGGTDTDEQQLTLEAGNLLTLEDGGTPINLTPFLDNTDAQNATAVPVAATPTNYAVGAANVEAHLAGIDAAIGAVGGNQDLASVLGNGTSAGNNQINNLSEPTAAQDAATMAYVLSQAATGSETIIDAVNSTIGVTGIGTSGNPYVLTGAAGNPDATDVNFTSYISITSPNVQGAIQQLKDEVDGIVVAAGGNPTDELQDLQLTGSVLTVTNPATLGNQVDLDTEFATDAELASFTPDWTTLTNVPVGFADDIDDNTTYSAGAGLSLTGTVFAVDNTTITPDWSTLTNVPVGFADDIDDNTTYSAGAGLSLTGTVFAVDNTTITPDWTTLTNVPVGFADDIDDNTTYSAGAGLSLTGTVFAVDNATITPDWTTLTNVPVGFADNIDDNTTYTAGTGLSLTGTVFAVDNTTITPDWTTLTNVPVGFADDIDDNTTYSAGAGLSLTGTVFAVDNTTITPDWTTLTNVPVGFADDIDDNTTYTAGAGLSLTGTVFAVDNTTITPNWTTLTNVPVGFADDIDDNTTYTAGAGLSLTGTMFAVDNTTITPNWTTLTNVPVGFADDIDDNTTYSAGAGLSLTGTVFAVDNTTITPDWTTLINVPLGFADDIDDNTTYSAGAGLTLTGTTFAFDGSSITPDWTTFVNVPAGFADDTDDDTTYSAGAGLTLTGTTFAFDGSSITPDWTTLINVPAGFADDTDDDTTYSAGAGLTLTGTTFAFDGSSITPDWTTFVNVPAGFADDTDDDTTYSAGAG